MKRILIVWLILPWVLLSNAQVASINNNLDEHLNAENSGLVRISSSIDYPRKDRIDPEHSWPITCFEENDIWVYFDEDFNEGYFTFYDPTTGKANNGVYEGKEDYFFNIFLGVKNQGNFAYNGKSNLRIGSFIDPESNVPYLIKITNNASNIENYDFANISIIGNEYETPCSPEGVMCATSKNSTIGNYKTFTFLPEEYNIVDFSTQPCEPIPELACDFEYNIVADAVNDDIVLNTLNIDAQGLKILLNENAVSKVQFIVTGVKDGDSDSQTVDFVDIDASIFDPINWSATLLGFASYNEFFYQILVYDEQGNQISCPSASEINLINTSLYCDIFTSLKHTYSDGILTFDFNDPNNANYLSQVIDDLGYTIGQVESLISSELTSADFNLSYADGGPYFQLSENVSFYNGINLESFEVSFDIGEVSTFSGALQIEYFATNGLKNSCLINPILLEDEEETDLLPELDCNSIPPDLGDMSTILKSEVHEGDHVKINGFPMVILSITSGDNNSGIFGEGLIPLPFKKKQLYVNFSNIKVNEDNQVINGQAIGKNGPGINTFPDFELPPVYIGGDICVPPPITGPLDGSGIDPVTGLDGYGFDPVTGKHNLTDSEYDPDGYDINGNHIDTDELWNEDGCSREGILYAPDPNSDTGEMIPTDISCDPTGGTPPELQNFIDQWKPKLDDTLQTIFDDKVEELLLAKNGKNAECNVIKQVLLDNEVSIGEPLPFGDENILINNGMSEYFEHEPIALNVNGDRLPKPLNTEKKHIELYHCDVELMELEEFYTLFLEYDEVLLIDIKAFIEDKISKLKINEFDELQKPGKFKTWLLNAILEYISEDQSDDIGYLNDSQIGIKSQLLETSPYYDALVSNSSNPIMKGSTLDALAFEYGQGFETVMGYPRGIVAETLRKYQLDSGAENIASLLPLNIDTSFNRFDISILISSVVFNPTSSSMDVAAVITDTENNQKIAFGGSNLVLGVGALSQETSKLVLLNKVGIRLNNASRLFLNADEGNTYIEWDCNGFAGVTIDGSIQFCREYILPLHESNLEVIADENILYELNFKKSFDRFFNFHFEIEAPPFELTTMRDFKWRVGSLGLDYTSSKIDDINLDIPYNYNSQYYDQETGVLDNLWKGFYAKDIELVIPDKYTPNSSTEYTAAVKNLIIDDTGVTAHVEVGADPGVLPWDEGNINGWQMSIESINLLILQNSLAGGGIGGKIGLPVLKDPLKYSGTFYGKNILFSVKPDSVCNFSPFGVKVKVLNNSYVQAEFGEQGFLAKAHLHGELDFTGFEGGDANLILPHLKFEGLEVMNVLTSDGSKKLKFSPGRWGVMEDQENNTNSGDDQKPLISAFGISINKLSVHSNDTGDGLFLKVNTSVSLLKESLKAKGDIELHGGLDPDESVFKMTYNGMKINSLLIEGEIKNILRIDGYVYWYNDTKGANIYGDGFRGAVGVELMKLFPGVDISAACQFGSVDNHDYYFVDLVADIGIPLKLGAITFDKFGGGLSKGMYPNYTNIKPLPDFLSTSEFSNSPLGTTITGIKYEPNANYGHEFKILTGFYVKEKDIFSGTGELLIRMTNTGSLDEIEIRAQGQFLKELDPYNFVDIATLGIPDVVYGLDSLLVDVTDIPKPNNNAALTGFASIRFNFTKGEFAGKVAAYLNMPGGVIKGTGTDGALCMVDIFIGRHDWWIWVGEPQAGRRAGLKVDLVVVSAGLQAYLNIGTKIPPFPGLPFRVAHLGGNLNITESARTSTFGFAFGASFDFLFNGIIGNSGLYLAVGAGFDIMFRKYDDILCSNNLDNYGNPKEIGIEGWYAIGQAWAYINGSLKILGYNIIDSGFSTLLQLQTPNPTWGLAALEIPYKVLIKSGVWKGDLEFGSRCDIEAVNSEDEFGLDLIVNVNPHENQRDVGLDQSISIDYLFPLADTISGFNFLNGESGELTFEIDQDSFGLFNEDGLIPCEVIQDKHLNSSKFKPEVFLSPHDSLWTIVKVNILKDGVVYGSQSKVVPFKTSSELEVIHKSNVAFQYPVDGMTNFHTEQLASQQGYIKLHRGQSGIFYSEILDEDENPVPYEIKARFTSDNGYSFTEDLVYDPVTLMIKFMMPKDHFLPSTQYKLEIVRIIGQETSQSQSQGLGKSESKASDLNSQDKIFYTSYFRTSQYTTVTEKFFDLYAKSFVKGEDSEGTIRVGTEDDNLISVAYFNLGSGEVFDYFDLISSGNNEPLVDFIPHHNNEYEWPKHKLWALYESKGFWPQSLKLKVISEVYFKGIVKQHENITTDYKIDVNSFESNGFICETGALSFGAFQTSNGKISLKAAYNFPGHGEGLASDIVAMPLHDLEMSDFLDKLIPLGEVEDYIYTPNKDITKDVIDEIIKLNNE